MKSAWARIMSTAPGRQHELLHRRLPLLRHLPRQLLQHTMQFDPQINRPMFLNRRNRAWLKRLAFVIGILSTAAVAGFVLGYWVGK